MLFAKFNQNEGSMIMNIIVAGSGKIGGTLIQSFVAEGHNVTVIDNDPDVINEITNIYDVMGITGNAIDSDVLIEAGIENVELFVAVMGSDEQNMLGCYIAKCMGASYTVARIRNPEYNDQSLRFMKKQLGISMAINPEMLVAEEIFNILKFPAATKIESFSRRNFELVQVKLKQDTPLDGMKLMDVRNKFPGKYLICVVERDGKVFIPGGMFELHSGDTLGITATPAEIQKFLRSIGVLKKQARDMMILGGSKTAFYLAKMLENAGTSVKIIDKDEEKCKSLSDFLDKSVVIHGDGAQQELLFEEGIRSTDAFVSLTGMDEQNILISVFASSNDVPKVIAKVNRPELASMAHKLGLDSIVSPKNTISDILVRFARALQNSLGSNIETLYNLMDGSAEALEFNVKNNFGGAGVSLKQLKLKSNILIAGIVRDRKPIIPSGDDCILEGDSVVVIAANHKLSDLSDILA